MKIRDLSRRDQLRAALDACGAGFCGACFGLLLGFGCWRGVVWYDAGAGVRIAAFLGALFFCAAIFGAVFDFTDDDQ